MARDSEWREHVGLGKSIDVGGVRTFYVDLGEGSPLMLLHGWASSSFTWRRNYSALAERFRVIAVDLPGFGLSERLESGYEPSRVTEHLLRFAEALGIERFSTVGLSMGGVIAAQVALTRPETVSKLVLVNPAFGVRGPKWASHLRRAARRRPVSSLLRALLINRYVVKRVLSGAVWVKEIVNDETVTGYYMSIKGSGRTLLDAFDVIRGFDPAALESLKVPTLFVLGERDSLVPCEGNLELAGRIGAEVVLVRDAGHLVQEERPDDFNAAVIGFLSR